MIACSKFCHYASVICVFHKVQVNRFLVFLFEKYGGPVVSRQFQFTHGNFNLLTAISICSQQFQQRSRHFSLRSPPVNYGGREGRTQTGMSSYRSPYISFHAFTWDRPKNELRPVWLHPRSLTRHKLLSYRSDTVPFSCKTKTESQTGSINSIFLRMTTPFLLFLSKNRNTATNNIGKQDLEVASMLGLIWGIALFWDAVHFINRPPDECEIKLIIFYQTRRDFVEMFSQGFYVPLSEESVWPQFQLVYS